MDAVVLAAGIGSRLRPLTLSRPKSCVRVDGTPILEHQLRAYARTGIEEVYVVAGYMADQVESVCRTVSDKFEDLTVHVVENEAFANTNNLYSLNAVREIVDGEAFLLSNGDVVFDPEVLELLWATDDGSYVACDVGRYDEEAMKVTVDDQGRIARISKSIDQASAYATSIDVYRFSAEFSASLFDEVERLLEVEGEYSCWTERAIDAVVKRDDHDAEPIGIGGARWVEIDDGHDLLRADRVFSSMGDLREKEAVFLDLDGTVYIDDRLIEGAADTVATLRDAGVDVYFLTNNSSRWKTDYVEKLLRLDISAATDDVIISTDGVIEYLDHVGIDQTFVVGTEAMREAMADQGISTEVTDPDAVVVGFDTELTYEKVRKATLAIRNGAEYLLAHRDTVCPTAEGLVPDCGSIGALVTTASEREPTQVFGKPNPEMITHVLESRGITPEDAAVVGDRLETDIRLAERVGCDSICVLSGEATRAEIEDSRLTPSLIVEDIGQIFAGAERDIRGSPSWELDEVAESS